jgi:predicted ATPase
MSANTQTKFINTELNPDLLETPFKLQTNWHVITGAPSCGKTTLINLLAEQGFQTSQEGARLYLEREIDKGRTLSELRSNEATLQSGIKDMHLEIEYSLEVDTIIFLDRAVVDCLAYYRVFGLDPNEFLEECKRFRYVSVFMLERLPLELNGFRYKDNTVQEFTEEWHIQDYQALGYSILRVPVLPPEERLAFVLDVLSEQGLM